MNKLKLLASFKGNLRRKEFFIIFFLLSFLLTLSVVLYAIFDNETILRVVDGILLYFLLTSCIKRSRDIGWNEMIGFFAWLPFAFDINWGFFGGWIPLPIGFLFFLNVPLLFLESSFRSKK